MIQKNIKISFVSDKLEKEFDKLRFGRSDERELFFQIINAFDDMKNNLNNCIKIPKKLWPKFYVKKYKINNLWKYNLKKGWRIIFTLESKELIVISIVLEILNHKEYEKRFGY